MFNQVQTQQPPMTQDDKGFWWYYMGEYKFGPYNSQQAAKAGYQRELKAPNPHKNHGVWA